MSKLVLYEIKIKLLGQKDFKTVNTVIFLNLYQKNTLKSKLNFYFSSTCGFFDPITRRKIQMLHEPK